VTDPLSGVSWRWLAQIALKGDFKDRKRGSLVTKAGQEAERRGLSLEQLVAMEEADSDGTRY
jgi:hypothetical protein